MWFFKMTGLFSLVKFSLTWLCQSRYNTSLQKGITMAYTGQQNMTTDEQLGVFSGYVRRPLPNANGMIAQIFGENGEDADTIVALSLTKFQDAQVFVNIYLIKDANGQIMKQGDNYPVISSFIGFVRRSSPKKDGMTAQFFAPNGEHADSISNLSRSDYQDCLVFVDVRGSLASKDVSKITEENIKEINSHYADKITKQQKKQIFKQQKHFEKMNENLQMSDFLIRADVLNNLGKGTDFKDWLIATQTCAHLQDDFCLNDSSAVEVPLFKPFNYLPCCDQHMADLQGESFETNRKYYEMKHFLLLKQWAWQIMKLRFSFDGNSEPDPLKVIDWAAGHNLSRYLPTNYKAILQ